MRRLEYMRSDTLQLVGVEPDLSGLVGTWVNTKAQTDYILSLIVREHNGALFVHAYGASSPEPVDWGEVRATPYATSGTREASGFYARYDFDSVETHLAANQKLGILVIQSYTSFKDGSNRLSHYAREFFHQ